MIKTLAKTAAAVVVALLFMNLLFGGRGDRDADIPAQLNRGALIVDTRTPGEFQNGHVKGAVNIPYDVIAQSIAQFETDPARPIVLYCRSGSRSAMAKRSLLSAGYTNVTDAGSIGNMQRQLPK